MEDKQRYLRLQLLLEKSNIYCQFLLEKMERQKLEARKQQERMAHQQEKKQNKEKEAMQMVMLVCMCKINFAILLYDPSSALSIGKKIIFSHFIFLFMINSLCHFQIPLHH